MIVLYTMDKPATTRGGIMEKRMKTHPDLVCYALDEKNRLSILDSDDKPREGTLGVEGFSMAHALQLALIELSYFEPYREFLRKHFDATNEGPLDQNKSLPLFNRTAAVAEVMKKFSMSDDEALDLVSFVLSAGGCEQPRSFGALTQYAVDSMKHWRARHAEGEKSNHDRLCGCSECNEAFRVAWTSSKK